MALGRSTTPDRAARSGGAAGDSLIAAGMVLNGRCHTDGALRVDGRVTGSVHADSLVVGRGGRIDGDVTGEGNGGGDGHTVVIDGHVEGAVSAPRVEIGPDGVVGGGVKAREAVVRGRVAGGILAEGRLLLDATAVVEGDVTARRLGLTEGGQVFGTIRIGERPPAAETRDEGAGAAG